MSHVSRWLSPLRILLLLALIFASTGSALALQDGGGLKGDPPDEEDESPGLVEEGLYVSPQFDVEITWTDAWEVGSLSNPDVAHAIGGGFDGPVASDPVDGDIIFLVDTGSESSVLSLGFSSTVGAMDPELLMAAMEDPSFLTDNLFLSEDAEILLLETDGTTVTVLAREAAPNDDHLVYMLITADPGDEDFSFWAGLDLYDADEYESVLTSLEDDVDVDGFDLFPVVSVDDILEAADSEASATRKPTEEPTEVPATEEPTELPATEEPTEEPTELPATEEPTEEPTEVPGTEIPVILPPNNDSATPGPFTPDGTLVASPIASPVANDSAELPGLLATGDYVSPQYGFPVTWTDAWDLNSAFDPAITSSTESSVDEIHLVDSATGTVQVYISFEPTYGVTDTSELMTALSDPAFIANNLDLPDGTEVVLSREQPGRLAVMYLAPTGDDTTVVILEAHVLDDGTMLYMELRGPTSSFSEELLTTTQDTIEAAGENAMDILEVDDVIAALPG